MRAAKRVLCAVVVGGVLFAANAALGAHAPVTGGAIQIWVTPSQTGNGGQVLITGVIADYGNARNVTATGKPAPKQSPYRDLLLKHGTILVNLAKYQKAENNADPAMYNKTDCSAYLAVSAPVSILSGTGAYDGITGTLTLRSENALILPKTAKGACNQNANPVTTYVKVTGAGTVKFGS